MTLKNIQERVETLAGAMPSVDEAKRGHGGDGPAGVVLYRTLQPTALDAMIYDPIVCLIVQGEKEATIGDETVRLREGQCVIVGHDLPVLARITRASPRKPYLALIIRLDLELLRTLDDALEEFALQPEAPRSLEVAQVSSQLLDVLERYLSVLDDPLEAKVLLPLVYKELHFRLLRSESGAMLRALTNRHSPASNVASAIRQLRDNFREALDVTELAKSVGMSSSSLHRHFKAMTRTTPLQYQKDLRLTEARRLLRAGGHSVSTVAFEVGYESPSQFSREYSRKFGASPRADLQVA
jgi:AraC-like DNA-binding protein